MSQHCHREENEATDSPVGTSGPPFRAIDQQHYGISHAGDHVVEDPQNPGGARETQLYESNGIQQHEMHRRIERLDQQTREETGTQIGQFGTSSQHRLNGDEPDSTTTNTLFTPTIEDDSSDHGFIIHTIQRALEVVAEPAEEGELLSTSAENLVLLGSAEIAGCTCADTETESYTCADDLTF